MDTIEFTVDIWVLIIAALSLLASVVIPFAQKKYEESRSKRNFQYYLKKQIGLVLNSLTLEKTEYVEPSVSNNHNKSYLLIAEFIAKIEADFREHKNTVQPRIIFTMIMNINRLAHYSYRLRSIISNIDIKNMTEKTLEHGRELSKNELNKIYGLLLVYESFIGISHFHDKFDKFKSITRIYKENIWQGLSVKEDLLQNQEILNDDLLLINDNQTSLEELENIILLLNQETKKYFDYDKN